MTDAALGRWWPLRAEVAQLQARQAMRFGAPDVPHQADTRQRAADPFDYDPRHHPRYVDAVMANASNARSLRRIEGRGLAGSDARGHPGPVSAS